MHNGRFVIKVDYSKFERDESIYGEIIIEDDGARRIVKVELAENEDAETVSYICNPLKKL